MLATLSAFYARPLVKIILSYAVVLCLGAGLGVWGTLRWQTPPTPIVHVVENVKYVEVPKDVIVTRDVIKYVRDTVEVKKLMDEAKVRDDKILVLTETIAKFIPTVIAGPTQFVNVPGAPEAHFKDWRLTFDAVGPKTTYQLTQKFESLVQVGKDSSGRPLVRSKMFEIGPGETRTELTDASIIEIITKPSGKRWYFSGAIQAGFAYTYDVDASKSVAGGVAGLQWLKRGYSKSAEDGIWSVVTPVAFISSDKVEAGVLPVSVNLGRIPKQPFRDLWVSPLLVFGKAPNVSPTRLGFVLTATF